MFSMNEKNTVSLKEVSEFKASWCNENQIIAQLLKAHVAPYFIEPVWDIGAGTGDLAYNGLFDKQVMLVDVNSVDDRFPLSPNHKRICDDFFNIHPENYIGTLFFSHVLQFIDNDIERLNNKLNVISPQRIVVVGNKNDDFLGDIISWCKENGIKTNPEEAISGFPVGYNLIGMWSFEVEINCHCFEELARQVSYLMLVDNPDDVIKIRHFLQEKLDKPSFKFGQSIDVFNKNDVQA